MGLELELGLYLNSLVNIVISSELWGHIQLLWTPFFVLIACDDLSSAAPHVKTIHI